MRNARRGGKSPRFRQAGSEAARELLDGNPFPFWVYDAATLRFLEANEAACVEYGYRRDEFLAMTIREIRPPGELAALEWWLRGESEGLGYAGIWLHRRKDGTEFPVEITVQKGRFQGADVRFVCAIDATRGQRLSGRVRKLSQAVEQSPSATVITDTEGRIEYVNTSFTVISGYTPEEVVGKTPAILKSGLTPPEVYRELWSTIKAGRSWRGHMCNRKKNGELYWESEYIAPLKDSSGEIVSFIAVKEDITEELAAAERLRDSEARFRQLAENVREVFFLVDPAFTQVLYVSPGYAEVWGRSCESLYAEPRSWFSAVHADDRDRVRAKMMEEGGLTTFDLEYQIRRPDGALRWVRARGYPILDEGGRVYRIAGIVEDITERWHAEAALRRSEMNLKVAQRNARIGSWRYVPGSPLSWSDEMYELFQLPRDTPPDYEAVQRLVHLDDRDGPNHRALVKAVESGATDYQSEFRIVRPDGEVRTMFSKGNIHRDSDGCLVDAVGTVQDVTERRQAEDQIRRLNDDLRKRAADLEQRVAERTAELEAANAELKAFDYTVSHDLRSPVTRIRGFTAMLDEECAAKIGARGVDLLRRIRTAGDEADALIGDLLELSTVSSGEVKRADVDLSVMANSVFDELQRELPARHIDFMVDAAICVHADPGLLRVVLQNLIGNAWKFTSRRDPARIEVGREEINGKTAIFVRDNGAGFDAANAGKLFAPFRRLHDKREYAGTGIGLATVQRVVGRHGGRVWAVGEVDKGATFRFTLAP